MRTDGCEELDCEGTQSDVTWQSGDSGGPLFQTNKKHQKVLFGVASTVDPECGEKHEYMTNFFTDIRKHLDWICVQTGVCPMEDYIGDGSF
ncbi:hypothetical protein Y032_0223g2660 [Ancylostoma ceylanicum]|uniref:Peptidase S1 domain-containing protein n=1 Tax=Ancylostoma ceylanicum TaxID=53326 RepID=A0A016SHP3_9BILA|nr:hypothetical protein Y032_0223g2660 [Ancylostoma ceylanicum]